MFKNKYPNVKANAFHQNDGTFYNRKELFESYGFDYFYDIEDMKEYLPSLLVLIHLLIRAADVRIEFRNIFFYILSNNSHLFLTAGKLSFS